MLSGMLGNGSFQPGETGVGSGAGPEEGAGGGDGSGGVGDGSDGGGCAGGGAGGSGSVGGAAGSGAGEEGLVSLGGGISIGSTVPWGASSPRYLMGPESIGVDGGSGPGVGSGGEGTGTAWGGGAVVGSGDTAGSEGAPSDRAGFGSGPFCALAPTGFPPNWGTPGRFPCLNPSTSPRWPRQDSAKPAAFFAGLAVSAVPSQPVPWARETSDHRKTAVFMESCSKPPNGTPDSPIEVRNHGMDQWILRFPDNNISRTSDQRCPCPDRGPRGHPPDGFLPRIRIPLAGRDVLDAVEAEIRGLRSNPPKRQP